MSLTSRVWISFSLSAAICILWVGVATRAEAVDTSSSDNAIAVSSSGQCAAVRQYFDASLDTKIPSGWTVYTGERLDLYETPLGNCRFSPSYDATCCRQLGLTYTEYESQRVLKSTKEAVSICGGGLGSVNLYCKDRPAETRNATIDATCGYSTLYTSGLIINQQTKYCSLVTKASTYSRIYTISGDQLGTKYDLKDSRDFTKEPTNCPAPEIKGTIYQPFKIEKGIWHNQRWCDLSKVNNIGDCCQQLGLTKVAQLEGKSSGGNPLLIFFTLIGLGALAGLAMVVRRRPKQSISITQPMVTNNKSIPSLPNSLDHRIMKHPLLGFVIGYLLVGVVSLIVSVISRGVSDFVFLLFASVLGWPFLTAGMLGSGQFQIMLLAIITILTAIVTGWWWFRHLPKRPASVTAASVHRSWIRRWWWLIIAIPILIFGWFIVWVWVGSTESGTGAYGVATFGLLGSAILMWTFWHRGKTGKFLSVIAVLAAVALFLPAGYHTWRNQKNYVRIHREAANTSEQQLISLAENSDCPSNQSCLEPLDSIAGARKSNAGGLSLDEIKFNIHTEIDYYAKVDTGFPGSFNWPTSQLSSGQISDPKYFSSDGQVLTAQQCQDLAGPKLSVVGLWLDYNYYCPLCGSGGVSERRVYFSESNKPVCQALYEYGSWISRGTNSHMGAMAKVASRDFLRKR